jgi:membrane protein implicated in regulation of membrane protease activity
MEQIYYGVAIVVYGVFIVRFILSWVGGDFDIDADADIDLSDVVSFKGATHFLMGVSGWLSVKSYTTHNVEWYDYIAAIALGLIFVVVLYFVYKFMMSLETKPQVLSGKQLVGQVGKIYSTIGTEEGWHKYLITVGNNVGTLEYPARSMKIYQIGDSVVISDYQNAYYII